ncbi:serine hydrolase [Paracoccaceae bacterium]|nr:serine hydrolase [Paracoccaceae bacterium]
MGPFKVNFQKSGNIPNVSKTSMENKSVNKFLGDNSILRQLLLKMGKTDSNTPLLGMSMSKTATGASVGNLLCTGHIKSLDDKAGDYSNFLASTSYADVTIRNILQMNSGVSPIGRADEKLLSSMARGLNKFQGKASVRKALEFYPIASRQQASQMNYHLTDTLALSVLVEDIIGSPLSYYFYENLYNKFGISNYMHWTADNSGTTVAFSDLVMTAKDWANFGNFLMTQKKMQTCLGQFFNQGIKNSVSTGKENGSRYGFQSWVYEVGDTPTMVLQGHGGQFVVLDQQNNTLLLTISMNENYKAGNLFSNINKFAEALN